MLEDIKRGIAQAQAAEQPAPASITAGPAAAVCEAEAGQAPAFDYSVLDEDTAEKLRGITECVMDLYKNYAWDMAYQVGRAHDLLCGGGVVKQFHNSTKHMAIAARTHSPHGVPTLVLSAAAPTTC